MTTIKEIVLTKGNVDDLDEILFEYVKLDISCPKCKSKEDYWGYLFFNEIDFGTTYCNCCEYSTLNYEEIAESDEFILAFNGII